MNPELCYYGRCLLLPFKVQVFPVPDLTCMSSRVLYARKWWKNLPCPTCLQSQLNRHACRRPDKNWTEHTPSLPSSLPPSLPPPTTSKSSGFIKLRRSMTAVNPPAHPRAQSSPFLIGFPVVSPSYPLLDSSSLPSYM